MVLNLFRGEFLVVGHTLELVVLLYYIGQHLIAFLMSKMVIHIERDEYFCKHSIPCVI